jgi:hypothetical protein
MFHLNLELWNFLIDQAAVQQRQSPIKQHYLVTFQVIIFSLLQTHWKVQQSGLWTITIYILNDIYCDIMAERRTVEPEKAVVDSQRQVNKLPRHQTCRPLLGNSHLTGHATIEELLEAVFSMRSTPRLYNEDQWDKSIAVGSQEL